MDFCGALALCCGCPKQWQATQMAVRHQAGFWPLNEGDSWNLMNPTTHGFYASIQLSVTCLKLFPPYLFLFHSNFPPQLKKVTSSCLSQQRQRCLPNANKYNHSDFQTASPLSSVKPQGVVRVEHLCFTNRKACTQQVKILIRIFSPAITRPGFSLQCIMK